MLQGFTAGFRRALVLRALKWIQGKLDPLVYRLENQVIAEPQPQNRADGNPPADWLAKVSRGAPQLLTPMRPNQRIVMTRVTDKLIAQPPRVPLLKRTTEPEVSPQSRVTPPTSEQGFTTGSAVGSASAEDENRPSNMPAARGRSPGRSLNLFGFQPPVIPGDASEDRPGTGPVKSPGPTSQQRVVLPVRIDPGPSPENITATNIRLQPQPAVKPRNQLFKSSDKPLETIAFSESSRSAAVENRSVTDRFPDTQRQLPSRSFTPIQNPGSVSVPFAFYSTASDSSAASQPVTSPQSFTDNRFNPGPENPWPQLPEIDLSESDDLLMTTAQADRQRRLKAEQRGEETPWSE